MIFILTSIAAILLFILFFNKKHKNLPPGPSGLPLIGNAALFKKRPHETLANLGKKYGNIFRLYFGPKMMIVLNDYEAMKESLLKQGDCFAERPSVFLFYWYQQEGGIIISNGKIWKDLRRFSQGTLKDFGFGKSSLEDRIMIEVHYIIEIITKYNGKPMKLDHNLDKAMFNIIFSLACDKRYDYTDETLDRILTLRDIVFEGFGMMNPINFIPPLRFISPSFKKFKNAVFETRDFLNRIVDEHIETYQPESLRDFIDVYIQRMKKDKEENVKDTSFTRDNIYKIIENFFNAGTETSSTTILWGIVHLIRNPDKQKKVEEEIQRVIGTSRSVSLNDRLSLPYTEATLLEIQRIAALVPLGGLHQSSKDTTVLNYFIPKNTIIVPNIWAIHFDPKYWPNPTEFKPERFLDANGNVLRNAESFVPFSLGKRACLGEPLAKMELFLFFANMLQRFSFTAASENSLPDVTDYIEGVTLRPRPFLLRAIVK